MTTPIPYGAPMRQHFCLDPKWKNLNHGSFGTYPLTIQSALRAHQSTAESHPDLFIRRLCPSQTQHSLNLLSTLLNAPSTSLAFVKNATTGVNTILHNIPFTSSDVIIYFDTIYGAIEYGLLALQERTGVQLRKVEYTLPISHDEIVRRFRDVVERVSNEGNGMRVKAAVFDMVVSVPGVRFPFEALVRECKELGVLSVVDGAHGVGMLEVDLGTLGVDFWTSNLHKWLYIPRGCAVLYVAPQHQHLMRTTSPTSWGYISPSAAEEARVNGTTADAFRYLFQQTATNDDTPYLCVPEALKFREEECGGEKAIYGYLERLANEAADLVAGMLGTEVLRDEEGLLTRCAMTNVRLLVRVGGDGEEGGCTVVKKEEVGKVALWFQNTLLDEYNTFVPVFEYNGWLWTRLSAQVYLDKSDFEWLGGVLKELCGRVGKEALQKK
ncbi:aminotransferase family protein [Aspergillus eucalypticola CBS 122712]|uniref:Aminotransferase family protein n=1 Tax=Aspergillus eucalypticola (strain CBS 122712 / IBT 29274) TaxID=1448314 RepID=A0A317VCI2_ASPEC|nr:aminotransferase family protein [Aspergillus eucalypticola CBS 122712]PWY72083.1 aminotransferase family protein [Aspergillus eucalypticola CBS 122712]